MRLHEGSPFCALALILCSCLFLCWITPSVNSLVEDEEETNFARDMIRRSIFPRDTREFQRYQNESSSRIVGGCEGAGLSYQCYIIIKITLVGDISKKYRLFCGCSWIDCKGTILTAAHCLDKTLLEGEGYTWDTTDMKAYIYGGLSCPLTDPDATEITTVPLELGVNVHIHEDWDAETLQNDICVLHSDCTFAMPSGGLAPIYPAGTSSDPGPFPDVQPQQEVIVSGCGISEPGLATPGLGIVPGVGIIPPGFPKTLLCVKSIVCSTAICNMLFLGLPSSPTVTDDMICMSGLKPEHPFSVSTCNGDSGGPLVVCIGGKAVLIGVVSFGFKFTNCRGYPSVFTKVSSYGTWIDSWIESNPCEPFAVPCEFATCPTCDCKKG